ncbi:MAG: glycosyltransferase family 39 protein [Solirubrobacterales bacterium]|nr:glycosyltransferase family 39 protein [Solirubrobacterales bacterium]
MTTQPVSSWRTRNWRLSVAAVTLAGAVARIVGDRDSIAWDEVYLYSWVHGKGLGQMMHLVAVHEKTPPLGFVLSWISDQMGSSPSLIRIPSLIAGVALIPLVAALGRRLGGQRTGVVAALLVAASPFLVFYSVEARSYSLTVALCTASTLLLVRALKDGRRADWVGYSLVAAFALMSHYTAFAVLAAQTLWAVAAYPRNRKSILLTQAGPLLAALIWLPWLKQQVDNSSDELHRIAAVSPLDFGNVSAIIGHSLVGHPLTSVARLPGQWGLSLVLSGLAVAAVALVVDRLRGRASQEPMTRANIWLLVVLALAPLALALGVSLQPGQSMLLARNLITAVPAVALLVASLMASRGRAVALASTALVTAGLALGTVVELRQIQRPATGPAADAIASRWKPGDRVIDLCCLSGGEGPLGQALALQLAKGPRDSLTVLSQGGDSAYAASLKTKGRVFIVGYRLPGAATPLFYGPPKPWTARFHRTWAREWPGLVETVAWEFSQR